jgi:hypothetical protein
VGKNGEHERRKTLGTGVHCGGNFRIKIIIILSKNSAILRKINLKRAILHKKIQQRRTDVSRETSVESG